MIHIDFETFSAAGYVWNGRWRPMEGTKKTSLPVVGAEVYACHPSTQVICLAWDDQIWSPGDPFPTPLWEHVCDGGLITAWNVAFEYWVWNNVLSPVWPLLTLSQLRDAMPRARAWALPGALGKAAKVLQLSEQKDTKGQSLIRKLSGPRNPTKNDPSMRCRDHTLVTEMRDYCLQDVVTERAVARSMPELSAYELRVWQLDQKINTVGIPVDIDAVDNAIELIRQAETALNAELNVLTGGRVENSDQLDALKVWAGSRGYQMDSIDKSAVTAALKDPKIPHDVKRALEIRQALSSKSTKKVWAFKHRLLNGRIYGQFVYCGADRTGRWSGYGIQPHNFPRGDAKVKRNSEGLFGSVGAPAKWCPEATEQFLRSLGLIASFDIAFRTMQERWGDPLKALSASLRGFIKAMLGKRLICSDFRAIEAVVLAVLAGEQWRIDVFNGHGLIYETSASKITGISVDEYVAYAKKHDSHHPDRQLGKLAELASGYQGGVGAWRNFGAAEFFTPERCEEYRADWVRHQADGTRNRYTLQDYAIQRQVWAWRKASPKIKEFWYGLQHTAMAAIREPGIAHGHREISYVVERGTLYCVLPSGRRLAYHQVRIGQGRFGDAIFYHGNNTNPKYAAMGWVELDTYGGKLVENVVQAVARDILAHAMLNLDDAGYTIVWHVHDEIVCEEPEGRGSVAEVEHLMGDLPDWAKGWPVIAVDGWEGDRYRK